MKIARIILGLLCIACLAGGAYYVRESRKDVDTEGPVLEAASDTLEVSIEDTEEALLKDVAAHDDRDGNVSDSIIIEEITRKRMERPMNLRLPMWPLTAPIIPESLPGI